VKIERRRVHEHNGHVSAASWLDPTFKVAWRTARGHFKFPDPKVQTSFRHGANHALPTLSHRAVKVASRVSPPLNDVTLPLLLVLDRARPLFSRM
jgi:hypothetical protein